MSLPQRDALTTDGAEGYAVSPAAAPTTGRGAPQLRALFVGGDDVSLRTMSRQLHAEGGEVCGEVDAAGVAVEHLSIERLDLVVVDLDHFASDGALGTALADAAPRLAVIALGSDPQQAIRAFALASVDFLLKPFDGARATAALHRVQAQISWRRSAAPNAVPTSERCYLSRLVVRNHNRCSFVGTREIDWIAAEDYYARLWVGRQSHLIRRTLTDLAMRLDPTTFVRVHRSAIVNLERIRDIQPYFKGQCLITLASGQRVTVSRRGKLALERVVGQRL